MEICFNYVANTVYTILIKHCYYIVSFYQLLNFEVDYI